MRGNRGDGAKRRGGASETNPDKRGRWTLSAASDFRRGECLDTACWRDALPRAIPDCRDRTPSPQRSAIPSEVQQNKIAPYIIEPTTMGRQLIVMGGGRNGAAA